MLRATLPADPEPAKVRRPESAFQSPAVVIVDWRASYRMGSPSNGFPSSVRIWNVWMPWSLSSR